MGQNPKPFHRSELRRRRERGKTHVPQTRGAFPKRHAQNAGFFELEKRMCPTRGTCEMVGEPETDVAGLLSVAVVRLRVSALRFTCDVPLSSRSILMSSNPFATRFTRPGAIEYRFPEGVTAEGLVSRLRVIEWRGQIVGPHGSGKSTLLHSLMPAIERAGKTPQLVTLHEGQRRLPTSIDNLLPEASSLLIVDGYEQLGRLAKWRLMRACRKRGAGLLVTSHAPVGLPTLYSVEPSLATTQAIVRELTSDIARIEEAEVARCFAKHEGNIRETLFELYDLVERRV
jgi:hypothetical protein